MDRVTAAGHPRTVQHQSQCRQRDVHGTEGFQLRPGTESEFRADPRLMWPCRATAPISTTPRHIVDAEPLVRKRGGKKEESEKVMKMCDRPLRPPPPPPRRAPQPLRAAADDARDVQ